MVQPLRNGVSHGRYSWYVTIQYCLDKKLYDFDLKKKNFVYIAFGHHNFSL